MFYRNIKMLLLVLQVLEKFDYRIDIYNTKKFIRALQNEYLEKQEKEVERINKIFNNIDIKIKQDQEKKFELTQDNEFER